MSKGRSWRLNKASNDRSIRTLNIAMWLLVIAGVILGLYWFSWKLIVVIIIFQTSFNMENRIKAITRDSERDSEE